MKFHTPRWLTILIVTLTLLLSACGGAQPETAPQPAPAQEEAAEPQATQAEAVEAEAPTPTSAPAEEEKAAEAEAPSASNEPTTFRIAVGIDPDTLDPIQTTTTTVSNIIEYIVETLTVTDKEGNVVPRLATAWEVSDDGLEYTLTLREGVTFSDGTPLNAEAVKWNLERALDPDLRVPQRAPLASIKTVEAVDDLTVKLTLSQPYGPLLAALSTIPSGIMSPQVVEAEGNTYETVAEPAGSGPYVFKERVASERIVFTRNENYWGEKPYYDEVVFQIVPEAATRESLLLAGQVDMIILPPVSDIPALQANPDVEVLLAPSNRIIFIGMNTNDEVLSDPRVRQALNYAVDKQAIIDSVLFGAAQIMDAPMASNMFGYCSLGAYEYDPDKAKALLAEAGVEDLELGFISPTGRYVQDFQASQAVAGYLEEVGIKTTVETMDWPSYVGALTTPPEDNTLDLHFLGWAPSFLDGSQQMVFYESSFAVPNGLGTTFYSNADVDEIDQAAVQESDPEKRKEMYCNAEKMVWEDAPMIFLWVQNFPIVYRSDVTGVDFHPTEKFAAIYARPAE